MEEKKKDIVEESWNKIIIIGFSAFAHISICLNAGLISDNMFNAKNILKLTILTILWSIFTGLIIKIPKFIRNKLK